MYYKPVILWDWNGTLLDDVDCCVAAMNTLLKSRDLPLINKHYYRDIFDFPVKEYYQKLGFDFQKEAFEIPAHQFMDHYNEMVEEVSIFKEATPLLHKLQQLGYRQFILSAMEQKLLDKLTDKAGIRQYFEGIHGINNHLAAGKLQTAKRLFKHLNTPSEDCLLIGDSLHDAEVAEALNIQILLFSQGHFSFKRLQESGKTVAQDYHAIEVFIEEKFGL